MATVSASLHHVKEHLEKCLPTDFIHDTCRQVGHQWRECVLQPADSVHILLLQLLAQVALRGLRHAAGAEVTHQAICTARMRLPLALFQRLVAQCVPKNLASTLYKGLSVFIVDGMSFQVSDNKPLSAKYSKSKNQRGVSGGYPTPKLLALMQGAGGFIAKAIILPYARQEFTCLSRLFKAIGKDAVLLGDRALVSFAHMALLMERGTHGCFRLPRDKVVFGRGKGCRRLKKRLGRQDVLVEWSASARPTWMSSRRWKTISDQKLVLRQITFRITRKGFRPQWAYLITTFLDPKEHPAQDIIDLYTQRWQIEVYFRDLKCTLKMNKISATTVQGVQKEVLAFILLYNLIRKVMAEAAVRQKVPEDRISFKDAMQWLLYAPPGSALPNLLVNPRRERGTQPRKIKKGRHRFPQLNQSRDALCKPRCEAKI